MTGKF